jgi:hypothetical protein
MTRVTVVTFVCRDDEVQRRYIGVPIPISFSAASIRAGGAILIVSARPVS